MSNSHVEGSPGRSRTTPLRSQGTKVGHRFCDGPAADEPSMRDHGRDQPMRAAMSHAVVTPSQRVANTSAKRCSSCPHQRESWPAVCATRPRVGAGGY
jgi:hypothetical protein